MAAAAPSPYWPRGVPTTLRVPQMPLGHFLDVAAQRYPDKAAIVYCDAISTYGELKSRVDGLAAFMHGHLGVRHGDRVLLFSQNCPQFVTAFYAIARLGAVVVPVNAMSTSVELDHYLRDTGAELAFVAQDLLPRVLPHLDGALRHAIVHAYADGLPAQEPANETPDWVLAPRQALAGANLTGFEDAVSRGGGELPPPPSPDSLCVLPYTSGTTGQPKGCMHTHQTILAANVASSLWRGLHAESVFLAVAPLFHMLGMQGMMNQPIVLGATIVMMPRWNARAAAHVMEKYRVSAWSAPPAMVIDFFSQPGVGERRLESLATLCGGGAAMPEAIASMLYERYGIQYNEAYGLSETASFLHANPPQRGKRQCLGLPGPGVDSRIIDPATLRELPAGEVGELVTHGPQVMLGYWRNEAANRQVFIELDGKRFLRTGDLANVDADGYFFMRERLKRMINASGYKVWPAEIENMMYEYEAVREACIVGMPDPKRGETVKAIVVLKPEYRDTVTEQDMIAWCRTRMAAYKVPRYVEFTDSLPKSDTGKVLWRKLQEAQQQAHQASPCS
ncbi:long-chain-fatty-acid--CoA ligase [Bordetella petrii]|uniref:long-chain-fatty-acid--CoA ligase n=1 Tax=Bordetella petrii TaxID=94624 RepID=UPI001E302AF2|nr:long-chain-fatty-acid--CoA ligase [Bordetella petrii]MCD0502502.1 AMP-binding protein [Bordetella petrii]